MTKNISIALGEFPVVSETFIVNQITYLLDEGYSVNILSFSKGKKSFIHQNIIDYQLLNKCSYYIHPPKSKWTRLLVAIKLLLTNFNQLNWTVLFRSLNFFKHKKEALNLSIFYQAQWFILNKHNKITHVHFGPNSLLFSRLKAIGLIDNKLILSFHGYDLTPNKLKEYTIIYRDTFKYFNQFVVNSQYTFDLLNQIYTGNNVSIIPVGLDTNKFRADLELDNKTFKILFCGRLINWKGASIAIDIMNNLINLKKHKNLSLSIIGDGPLKGELITKIRNYNLDPFIKILGAQKQENIIVEMAKSNILLHPAITEKITLRSENQGLVIQEAQSIGIPVVISDAGGMKYGILANKSGFIARENDIIDFSDKIEKLINSKTLCSSMGKQGREYVVQHFDMKIIGQKLIALYNPEV